MARVDSKELQEKPSTYGRANIAKLYRGRNSSPSPSKGSFWNHDFSQCISSLLGATSPWQIHPAVVWRGRSGVDHVHVIFPSAASRRLRLRALAQRFEVARTGVPALCGRGEFTPPISMPGGSLDFSDHPRLQLETARRRSSGYSNRDAAQRQRGFTLFCSVLNRTASSSLVLASLWERFSLSAVLALELGFLPVTPGISGAARTWFDVEIAGMALVFGVLSVCHELHV